MSDDEGMIEEGEGKKVNAKDVKGSDEDDNDDDYEDEDEDEDEEEEEEEEEEDDDECIYENEEVIPNYHLLTTI